MTSKVKCIPKSKYTFDEVGEFIFQSNWGSYKSSGINIALAEKMMKEFEADWDSDTDKYKVVVIEGLRNLAFKGEELRHMYKIIPLFNR